LLFDKLPIDMEFEHLDIKDVKFELR
jgi:hypothetical protein